MKKSARESVSLALEGAGLNRPLFCPAVYEHKAVLIGKSPSELSQDANLMAEGVFAEYEIYKPELLTVGIDIYNIEAEALGCKVTFPDGAEAVPTIVEKVLGGVADISCLAEVDPEKSGRMPLMLEAASRVNEQLGEEVFVRGALTGPFSMAAELVGIQELLMAIVLEPEKVEPLLEFCTKVAIDYGKAFLGCGVELCIFDSQAAPPLVSPDIYGNMILPRLQRMIAEFKDAGAKFVEYVVGGDTTVNAEHILASGADILLSDFCAEAGAFLDSEGSKGKLVRRNISSALIETGSEEEIDAEIDKVLALWEKHSNVIVGTGVLSCNVDSDRIIGISKACRG